MTDYSPILARLKRCRPVGKPGNWSACCPAHDDAHPSLGLWIGRGGELRAKCHSRRGCTFRAIAEAIGVPRWRWFPDWEEAEARQDRKQRMAEQQSKILATYPYRDEEGRLLYQCVRFEPKRFAFRRPLGGDQWGWNLDGVDKVLYHLPELLSQTDQPVIIVEGEKDVHTLETLGLVATTNPCGAGQWLSPFGRWLRGRRCVVLPDNDDAGQDHADHVVGNLISWGVRSIRLVRLPGLPDHGDVTDWLGRAACVGNPKIGRQSLIEAIRRESEWRATP